MIFRMNSVSDSTKKARNSQWRRYLQACEDFDWTPIPCGVEQACKYVTVLSDDLSFGSILNYYQAVIFQHVCAGVEPVRPTHQILGATLNGIKKMKGCGVKGKDPLFPAHLKSIVVHLDKTKPVELLVFVAVLLLFRTLLRVSHVVVSSHTLCREDVKFNPNGCLIRVKSSKTSLGAGAHRFIPVTWAADKSICAVRGLRAMFNRYPAAPSAPLFVVPGKGPLTYSTFSKIFKVLLERSKIVGDFASHSLRRGGATYMSMVGCTVPQVKERGGWKSDCVYRYIKPSIAHRVSVDKKFSSMC